MRPRPHYLGPEHAARFKEPGVAANYHLRVPYPDEVFEILLSLITGEPRAVLDVGSGSGEIARRLVEHVERVDAVDFSMPMIEKGRSLPGGDHPLLNWIYGRIEEVELFPPYGLVTAGQSLHWMEWDIVFPRFRAALVPGGYVAIVGAHALPTPWSEGLVALIKHFSTNPHYQPIDLIKELEARGLYSHQENKVTSSVAFIQSVDDYIESFHAMSSLSRGGLGEKAARAFDQEVRELVSGFAQEGKLTLQVVGNVAWGRPL